MNQTTSGVILFTGLSGAGKTTIAKAVQQLLLQQNLKPVLLDGDDIRNIIQLHTFDEASRKQYNLRVAQMAALFEAQGHLVMISLIAPYEDVRLQMRNTGNNFKEVYLCADIDTCMQRDPKGLYKKALAGEIKEFTGISAPYYPPQNPELKLDTSILSVDECAAQVLSLLSFTHE
ncbi:MAG: adenylyl-sulfate kinase [Chitinophagaceae bacterium]|nr:adenylyl-sulfate kinase [Chitinophagaceae bacterium]